MWMSPATAGSVVPSGEKLSMGGCRMIVLRTLAAARRALAMGIRFCPRTASGCAPVCTQISAMRTDVERHGHEHGKSEPFSRTIASNASALLAPRSSRCLALLLITSAVEHVRR